MRSATPCREALRAATASASGLMSTAVMPAVLCRVAPANRQATQVGAHVEDGRFRLLLCQSKKLGQNPLGVVARNQNRRTHLELQRKELLATDQVSRRTSFGALANEIAKALSGVF